MMRWELYSGCVMPGQGFNESQNPDFCFPCVSVRMNKFKGPILHPSAIDLLYDACIVASLQMHWLLKGMGDGTLIGLLHVMAKTHLRVSDQPIFDLRRA